MSAIIILLIIFFILLIFYQLYSLNDEPFFSQKIIEGVENQYREYDPKLIVQVDKNTSNIEYLKDQVDKIGNLDTKVNNLNSTVQTLQGQIQDLTTAQQSYLNPVLDNPEDEEDDTTTSLVPQETNLDGSTDNTGSTDNIESTDNTGSIE